MNDFVVWALRQHIVVRILVFLSLTGAVVGMLSRFLPQIVTLVVGIIIAAFFAAVLFPTKKRLQRGEKEDEG